MTVAALFVDPKGLYPTMLGVENCWDEARDARLYAGDAPVVAHPPCNVWCSMARLNEKRYGRKVGDDGGCFAAALRSLVRCGGVLEHPAKSLAWSAFGLPRPVAGRWTQQGPYWTCEVWQSAYGHKARKSTWLLYVGLRQPSEMCWDRTPGTHQIGWFDRNKPTLSKSEAIRTPEPFARALIALAEGAAGA